MPSAIHLIDTIGSAAVENVGYIPNDSRGCAHAGWTVTMPVSPSTRGSGLDVVPPAEKDRSAPEHPERPLTVMSRGIKAGCWPA